MNTIYQLLDKILTFIMNLFGKSNTGENWIIFPSEIDQRPAMISVDLGFSNKVTHTKSTRSIKITLILKNKECGHLPTSDEFEKLNSLEDDFCKYALLSNGVFVGCVTCAGERVYYFYLPEADEGFIEKCILVAKSMQYEPGIETSQDLDFNVYRNELYPTTDDIRIITDKQILEVLNKNGDNPEKERNVDHWIYFKSELEAKPFIDFVCEKGYIHQSELSGQNDGDDYCLRIAHVGTMQLDDITKHTVFLKRTAKEYSGIYDGWETSVEK